MSLFDPLSHALAAVVAKAHDALTLLGADPAAGLTWLLAIAAVVLAVRIALLPLIAHGVRLAHASARARPELMKLSDRYKNHQDREDLSRMLQERRRISAEHGVSRLGCLPMLMQLPIWLALYHLLTDVAGGTPVGAMTPELVASFGTATVLGVSLADRGYLGGGIAHFAVVAGMAATAAALAYVTQRYVVAPNSSLDGMPESMAQVLVLMPVLSAGGLLLAGGFVPLALLAYWVCNSAWTLGQSAALTRWFPTPGTAAALSAQARRQHSRRVG